MNFRTHNSPFQATNPININGTSLVGEVTTTYNKLVAKFGEPTKGDEYKVDAEWEIEFEDGTVATIYNYKDGKNYNGKSGKATSRITNWHVGGREAKALAHVISAIA